MATITISQAKNISRSEKFEARILLAKALNWEDFDDEDSRHCILLDFLYEAFRFAVEKGFPWSSVCEVVLLAKVTVDKSVDLSLLEAIQLYQREAVARLAVVSETNLKAFSEFFFADYLRHFRLYQLTLTRRRACAVRRVDVDVAVPTPSREAFASSKPLTIWQYEQQLVAMEQERQQALEQRRQQRARRMAHDGEAIAAVDDRGHQLSTPFNREELVKLIRSAVKCHVDATAHSITDNIKNTAQDLGFMLDKASLPRPLALGPPPRFTLQPSSTQRRASRRPSSKDRRL